MAAENDTDHLRVPCCHLGDVEAELETRPAPRDPDDSLTEASLGERFPVGGGRKSDTCVRVKVVDMGCSNQAVHGSVDRRRCTTLAVQAEVEGRDHLVFTLLARVNRHQFTQTVQAKNSEPLVGQAWRGRHPTLLPR